MTAGSATILVVEDDPDDIALLRRAIRKSHFLNPLQVVSDGDAAIAYLAGAPPYKERTRRPLPILMLLDLTLPRPGGLEVLAWLRQRPGLGGGGPERVPGGRRHNQAYELRVSSYLVRPVSFDDLMELWRALKLSWPLPSEAPDLGG